MPAENGKPATTGVRGVVSNREMDARIRALVERDRAKHEPATDRQVETEGART